MIQRYIYCLSLVILIFELSTLLEKALTFAISHHNQCLSVGGLFWGITPLIEWRTHSSLHHLDLFFLESPRWKEAESTNSCSPSSHFQFGHTALFSSQHVLLSEMIFFMASCACRLPCPILTRMEAAESGASSVLLSVDIARAWTEKGIPRDLFSALAVGCGRECEGSNCEILSSVDGGKRHRT